MATTPRSIASLTISFGLVAIPVKLYSATVSAERISFNLLRAKDGSRVKQQYIAADAYKRDGTAAVASELNEWIGVGDWTLYVTFPQKVQQVTPADVQRVAKQYLIDDQSTTGWFVPVHPGTEKGS